jgi:hypothetical protein
MNDPLSRAERLIAQLAGQRAAGNSQSPDSIDAIERIGLEIAALADSQKRTTCKIEALRQLIERNGNGRAGH